MKQVILTILIFLTAFYWGLAQVVISLNDYSAFLRDQNLRETVYSPRQESNVAGSPYLRDTFQKGEVLMRNKVKYEGVPLRYNIYLDELEFTDKKGQIWALSNPESLQLVELGEDKLVYRYYLVNKKVRQGFFLVLEEGKMSLYRKPKKFLQDPEKPGAYKEAKPAKFVDRPDEYYLQGFNEAAKLITGKKELISSFPYRQEEVAGFIKKNKVRINKPETLVELVKFYNGLSAGG